jgi:hypothetical protein
MRRSIPIFLLVGTCIGQTLAAVPITYTEKIESNVKVRVGGKVVDGSGKPLVGATVTIKGTTFVTRTNESGDFSIDYNKGDKNENS